MIENKTAEVYKWLKTVSEQIYISEKERENKIQKRIKDLAFINLILLIYALTQKNELTSRIFVICGIALFCIYSLYRTTSFPYIADFHSKSYRMSEDKAENCGRGWKWLEGKIDGLADEYKIVITTDVKKTTAKLYDDKKFIKEAKAKCSPEDEFDFKTGAELAFRRVLEVTSQKQFTGKAVYTSCSDHGLTRGKIYKFVDGYFWDDYNKKRPYSNGGYSENALEFCGFLPIKE